MKIFEIRELSTDDLKLRLNQEYESLENLRFQKTIGQLENFKNIKNTKKLIARIKTVLSQRDPLWEKKEKTKK
jgi:large subunit ribosomal protein L29